MSDRKQPKYLAIAADIDARIRSGHYAPGQALPGQRELSAAYGVTLMTLRQALKLLEERGLVAQHPGKGTFVSGPKASYDLGTLRSLSDELRAQGHTVDTELLGRTRRTAPRWVAEQLVSDEPALRVERLRRVNGTPAIHQVSWIPDELAEPLRHIDFTTVSLYGALANAGVVVARATERLTPAVLSERLSLLLDQPEGTPVFCSDRLTFGLDERPVVFDRATIVGELVEIRTERASATLSMRWNSPLAGLDQKPLGV